MRCTATVTETKRDAAQELLNDLREMEEEARNVGLCTLGFKILRQMVEEVIAERDALAMLLHERGLA